MTILGIVVLFIIIDVIVDLLLMKWWQVKKIEREKAQLEALKAELLETQLEVIYGEKR